MKLAILALATFIYSGPLLSSTNSPSETATAYFAGGCFWCMEPPFDKEPGVLKTTSGYMGGKIHNPTYKQVSRGETGHAEIIEVIYDPKTVDYARLLDIFWRNVDPTDEGGQFCDRGSQYRSEIFALDKEQFDLAIKSKKALEKEKFSGKALATDVSLASTFYPAEEYHQDYYQRNPVRYKYYRYRCGRDGRLEAVWGK